MEQIAYNYLFYLLNAVLIIGGLFAIYARIELISNNDVNKPYLAFGILHIFTFCVIVLLAIVSIVLWSINLHTNFISRLFFETIYFIILSTAVTVAFLSYLFMKYFKPY